MSIEYEYTDSDNATARPIPPGEYDTEVTGYEFGMSSSGTDKLTLTLYFPDCESTMLEDIYFTPRAQWKFDTVLKCYSPSKNIDLPNKGDRITINNEFVEKYLVGGEGRVEVREEEYNGKKRTRVGSYMPGARLSKTAGTPKGQQSLLDEGKGGEDVPF